MFRIASKEGLFFDLFIETADSACQTAVMLEELMNNYSNVNGKVSAIEEMEHTCDLHVHKMMERLNKSFITPIDREDIYLIAKELDNITDAIEAVAHRFQMLNISSIKEDAKKLANLIVKCTSELKGVMIELKNMKKSKILSNKIIEVNRIENEGDAIFRSSITKLFSGGTSSLDLIKWKEIYEYLENTLDACEDVANIVEGVVMKHA